MSAKNKKLFLGYLTNLQFKHCSLYHQVKSQADKQQENLNF